TEILQQTNIKEFEALLIEQPNSETYRPTLFDLLSHNALEFYKTDETSITKPAYAFEIENPNLLSDAETFAIMTIVSKDTMSLQLQALKIYKDLTAFHLKDKNPKALVDVTIERLDFVNQHAVFENKEDLLLKVLTKERAKWKAKQNEVTTRFDFEIAKLHQQQGLQYQPKTNEDHRWKLKEAVAVCDAAIKSYPNSRGAEKCEILKSQILMASLQMTTEEIIPIQSNGLALISYKNIETINFKIGKVSEAQLLVLQDYNKPTEQLDILNQMASIKSWTSQLKNENDYQEHTIEIVIPKLDNGRYIIFGKIPTGTDTFVFQELQVTNLAYVQKAQHGDVSYQIINRVNGRPIPNAAVELSFAKDYQGELKTKNYKTNELGQFQISRESYSRSNLKLKIKNTYDVAYFDNLYLNRYYNHDNSSETTYKAFLFTDRSIYRPGQPLYFKGIAMSTTNNTSTVLQNTNVQVKLYNVNGEELNKLELKTNDFGSVSGEFILPNNGLTGNFSIRLEGEQKISAYHSFSVEAYKRPKFETSFNPIVKTFRINDTVTVKGNAMAYAGSTITDAKVVYRVHRNVQYPHWYYWSRPYFYIEPQEITHGETITDADGNFEIDFKAIPDTSVDQSTLPTFSYEITADVTDLNGETRSATTTVNVGYQALTATIRVKPRLDKTDASQRIELVTQNLNGQVVEATGTVKIYKLIAPDYVLRPRPWKAPDYKMLGKDAFKNLLPHLAYDDEHDSKNWDKGEQVFSEGFDTAKSDTLALGKIKNWKSGRYLVVLESKDRFGQLVKDEAQTTVYSKKDAQIADNELFEATINKNSYAPGDTLELTLASASTDLHVTVEIEKDFKIVDTQIIKLSGNKKTVRIPISSEDLGGFVIHYSYAFQNSFKHDLTTVSVPYPKSDLGIETMTFRDKLEPGSDETWQFKIKGPKGDQVAAELLASMYDASLDQFKSHNWNFSPLPSTQYYSNYQLSSGRSFNLGRFRIENLNYSVGNYKIQYYDRLNFFGLSFGYNQSMFMKRSVAMSAVAMEESEAMPMAVSDNMDGAVENALVGKAAGLNSSTIEEELPSEEKDGFKDVKIRKNLQETAFFFPKLKTDDKGQVSFSFTTPEALTKWKLQLLAHTKTLESAKTTLEAVTQKELMVIPNAPRYLREGDRITISTKIANLTDQALVGKAKLVLNDALTGEDISSRLIAEPKMYQTMSQQYDPEPRFSIDPNGNTQVSWDLNVPFDVEAIQYKIIARAGDFSDGEQNALPVLTNRMLVTETLQMWIKSNTSKTFTLDKLASQASEGSSTLKNHKLTLEMTSNPAWYAVQALPYLMEYPYDCNEQTFSRYYANALASHIATSNPRIKAVFDQWASTDSSESLSSNLEKNQELKSVLIQETPWLRDAQSETEQKKRIALLFDLNKMTNELEAAKRKLKNSQLANGAWPWFNGGRANRYITQHIIAGFGHLDKLSVSSSAMETSMITKAIAYLDAEFVQDYKNIKKYNKNADLSKDHLSYIQLHYLYMRSFFPKIKLSKEVQEITAYYETQIQTYWLSRSLYAKGLMALITHRTGDDKTPIAILRSLRETSITSEELGMYWKANTSSLRWHQAPIETQALMIEAFTEIEKNNTNKNETIDNLKIWLLKNKQTNKWSTTKATTDAVYALLLQGNDWLSVTDMVDVRLGREEI
ncbi:alpha-2-macroglobulin family protein, partial [Psychroserpens sp.]